MSSDKRRGPIAAEFQGPGPAAIGLPSIFGSKSKLALIFQIRLWYLEMYQTLPLTNKHTM